MKLTLLFASILAVSGLCAAAPFIQERCGSNATITSQSSFIGDEDRELQIITASCPDRRRALGSTNNVDLTERDTCLPDPATCEFEFHSYPAYVRSFVSSCLGFAQPPTFVADCKTLLNSVTAFTPTFTVLEDQVIFIIFNTCQLDFGVGPQTTGICGSNWVHIILHELQKEKLSVSSNSRRQSDPPSCRNAPTWLAERPRATQACTISIVLGLDRARGPIIVFVRFRSVTKGAELSDIWVLKRFSGLYFSKASDHILKGAIIHFPSSSNCDRDPAKEQFNRWLNNWT
ncbi:hypothetical protein K438DRAFT_2048236 [Mycena galopus ATCC 62051]|nr:hypothetical protein K438DRAFT_2048236 [Mycena galopus ATCC 62051]